jgi:DME family drug/metabolite transporter
MRERGQWLILAAAMLWGTTGTAQVLAPPGASPAAIGAVRIGLGGSLLLAYALKIGAFRLRRPWPIGLTLAAAVCLAAYQIFFFAGVARAGVALGTIVGIGSVPMMGGVIGYLAYRERPGRRWALATLMAVAGCALLLFPGSASQTDELGLILAVAAGLAYAIYTAVSKRLIEGQPPEAVMAVTFCLGAALLLPVFWMADFAWLASANGLAVALHLGLNTVGVAYILFGRGLRTVAVSTTATLTLAEPLTAGTLGILLLGERLTGMALAGILLILAGLGWLTLGKNRK